MNLSDLPTDVQRHIVMMRSLAPATRKIRQKRLEANLGCTPGTLSELCYTAPRAAPTVDSAEAPAPQKPKRKRAAKKKKTTRKKKTD